ncbi:hypothetical protein FPZ12_010460 [Amycolatopsis acidicola]|uniref:Uncharacterized protein n=1 Tax=Amycolatopsis acidicola TaxID=2596893 RepID=A0A5N0VC90_9PSEU|nr:hypothetical protein [Amycolatopsis acidicola]KAA9162933.1 hypothetical protein FPZ12_010460 [Amycolatopsis acidicola]
MGDPYRGAVSWDSRGEDKIGVFHPGHIGLLRVHVNGLRKLALDRLAEYDAGPPGVLDKRLDAVLWTRRLGENTPAAPELDMLIPVANRLGELLELLPSEGGVVVLRGWPERYLMGTVALDVKVAIEAWLRSWRLGESVDGMPCPDEASQRLWEKQCSWLQQQIVTPLQPEPQPL